MDTLLGVSGGACVFTAGSIVATYTVSFSSYALKLAAVTSASPVLATATTAGEHFGHNVESISYSFTFSLLIIFRWECIFVRHYVPRNMRFTSSKIVGLDRYQSSEFIRAYQQQTD